MTLRSTKRMSENTGMKRWDSLTARQLITSFSTRMAGGIEISVNDAKDSVNVNAIRAHLNHIAERFSNGDFSIPMFVHSQIPPGTPVMKDKRAAISYTVEKLPEGAKLRIKTTDPDALKAVHDFLRFQIEDHQTGDSTNMKRI